MNRKQAKRLDDILKSLNSRSGWSYPNDIARNITLEEVSIIKTKNYSNGPIVETKAFSSDGRVCFRITDHGKAFLSNGGFERELKEERNKKIRPLRDTIIGAIVGAIFGAAAGAIATYFLMSN
jgi:hypothetical protein